MAKREIPLFIIDRTRQHKKGECDFLVCTDKDSGFIARIDYVDGEKEETGDDYRIGLPNGGVSCRMQVVRVTGERPVTASIRTLLKAGMEYFWKMARTPLDFDSPTPEECAKYLDILIKGNQGRINEGSPAERRARALSLKMLQATMNILKNVK